MIREACMNTLMLYRLCHLILYNVSHFATHCRCCQSYRSSTFAQIIVLPMGHPRWIQFWANVSRISWNVPMSWTARDDQSQKCLCCSCSPNPFSGNCASHALKDVWDAGIKICRDSFAVFSNICPLPLKINMTLTWSWRLWLMTKVLTDVK